MLCTYLIKNIYKTFILIQGLKLFLFLIQLTPLLFSDGELYAHLVNATVISLILKETYFYPSYLSISPLY